MKRILILAFAVIAMVFSSQARDNFSRNVKDLPVAARTTLDRNFKATVSLIKIDKDFGRISDYEVTLSDGSEVKFDSKGNWEEVEVSSNKSVPAAFVPAAVQNYVKKNHRGQRIVGIDKERNGYEVTLSNGVEIKFDRAGEFRAYD